MVPPLVQHALANQLEPGRELEGLVGEHSLQVVLGDVARVPHLVGAWLEIDVSFDEEDVVN